MKRTHKILLTVLCLALVVSAFVVAPVSASAATVSSNPYSGYNAPAGYYYFANNVSKFYDILDFDYTVSSGIIYYNRYRVLRIQKSGNYLYADLLDVDGVTVIENTELYRTDGTTGYWSRMGNLDHAVFYVADSLDVNGQFARLLLYRSHSQSLIVKGRYKLLDSINFDTSIWNYKMTGEFFVNGVLYDSMTITKDTKTIYVSNSANNLSDYLRYNGVNNGEYIIDIPFAFVTLSVFNNFYNIFSQISADSLYGSDYLYYSLNSSLPVPSFLDSSNSSKTFNVVGYFPVNRPSLSVMEFDNLVFEVDSSGKFSILYNGVGYGYSSEFGYSSSDSFYLLKLRATTVDPELLSYLNSNSYSIGGASASSYYEKAGYYSGLQAYEDSLDVAFTEGYLKGKNEGYDEAYAEAYGGNSYYWFTSLSESALNEIGASGFLVDITLVYPSGVSTSMGATAYSVRYDYLTYQNGQLLAAIYGEESARVIYSDGSFVDEAYAYWCLLPENSSEFVSWCDNNCYQKGYNPLLFYSSNLGEAGGYTIGYDEGYDEGYDIGYNLGFENGAGGLEAFDLASWLDSSVGGFMGLELFPGFSVGGIMSVVVGVALLSFFLKLFMGG